eukprot:XP_011683430.1 PREDICTED: uncharacterized protein LOC105447282 [Strongylocentrotus purpuratus]
MTRAVRWMGERDGEPVDLYYRHISLMIDEVHHALLEMLPPQKATIKVTVFQGAVANSDHNGDSPKPPAPCAVKEVKDFVERTLDDLIGHWARRIEYDICFLCPKCSKKKLLKDCFKRKSLKCGVHVIDTDAVKSRFGLTEASLKNRNSTSPKPSPSTSVLTSQGAAAAVSEVCTSTERRVCDEMLLKLAQEIPSNAYHTFSLKLGTSLNQASNILKEMGNYEMATMDCMRKWMNRSTRSVADLHEVLKAAKLEGLIDHCN